MADTCGTCKNYGTSKCPDRSAGRYTVAPDRCYEEED